MRRADRSRCLLALALMGAACSRAAPPTRPFEVVRTSPVLAADAEPVLLNDALTIYFTDAVQPLSITSESVLLLDEQGHRVPGSLRVGANWVTFQPIAPITPDLSDGSFHPGSSYRLHLMGSPRPDAVRSSDGRRLAAPRVFEVRIADRDYRAPGLAAPLRPPGGDLPFLLRRPEVEVPQVLAAEAPRLRLHFTQPVLPASVTKESFVVCFAPNSERILPISARVVRSRLDEFDGSTVEIDLGRGVALGSEALISVELAVNGSLTDYSGNPPLPWPALYWTVVGGSSVALAEWPGPDEVAFLDDDPLVPGFEFRGGVIRPRVRIEAGDGSLGVFRPRRDTVLRPGVPFDRGDGQLVSSRGGAFPFLAVDIRDGVTVVVDATTGPVQVLSCGGVRVDGVLEIVGGSARLDVRPFRTVAASELIGNAPVAVVAAGDVWLRGTVRTGAPCPADASPLTLAAAGRLHLLGALPCNTLLGLEEGSSRAIVGAMGQAIRVPSAFTYGAAPGADLVVRGYTSWRRLPIDRDGGVVRLAAADSEVRVSWQSAAPDPLRPTLPDVRTNSLARPTRAMDRDVISVPAGGFVRFQIEARVAGAAAPTLQELRVVDR